MHKKFHETEDVSNEEKRLEKLFNHARQEVDDLKEKYIALENDHQQVNLENQKLKLEVMELKKKYESIKMRMADMNNQLARGVHDNFYR